MVGMAGMLPEDQTLETVSSVAEGRRSGIPLRPHRRAQMRRRCALPPRAQRKTWLLRIKRLLGSNRCVGMDTHYGIYMMQYAHPTVDAWAV